MISVIVPVYNVEPYLKKCLDSIVNQTYTNLEILIIDDGSSDKSGAICDEYTAADPRIRVFHTENRGLSCARNLGLDNAAGEWIGFVDSDDWIEPDMYETTLKRAQETGADVVECGFLREYGKTVLFEKRQNQTLSGYDALPALLRGKLSHTVWNKLWKKRCFLNLRFPDSRVYEEIATTYKALSEAETVCVTNELGYHHLQRSNSISITHNINNLTGRWLSFKELYDNLFYTVDEELKKIILRSCAFAASRMWAYLYDCSAEDRESSRMIVSEINGFIKENISLFGESTWGIRMRIGVFFPHFNTPASFYISRMLNRFYLSVSNNGF